MNNLSSHSKMPTDEELLLVTRIAKHLSGRLPSCVRLEDLVQSGMVGLLEAMNAYDTEKGASFKTFASIRIRGAMIDELRKGDWAPRSIHRNSRRISEAMHSVEMETGRDAKDQEIADKLEVSLEEYHKMLKDTNGVRICEYEEIYNVSDATEMLIRGAQTPLEATNFSKFKEKLASHISDLPEKERMVLALYYEEDLNLKEVGEVMGVTESRISQIHSQAVHRLKSKLNSADYRDI